MNQKIALFLSISLTAFVLVILGAAIVIGNQVKAAGVASTLDPALAAQLQARDAAYQALLQSIDSTAQSSATPVPTPEYPVSPEAAAAIAAAAAPGSTLMKTPELVLYRGLVAYEVTLDRGLVYVDAAAGQVLFNAAVALPPAQNDPFRRGWNDDEHDD